MANPPPELNGHHANGKEHGQDDVFGWPSIAPIKARKAQQSNYPVEALPEEIQLVLMATVRLAGCSTHTAAASLMGSLSLLAQVDYTVQTLAPTAKPTSLFMLAISESGWRKSEAAQLLMSGHREADSRAVALHTMAKQQYEEEQKSGKKKGQENSPRPRTFQPLAFRNDATIEAAQSRMMAGRPWIIQAPDEATTLFGNWSFQAGQLGRSLAGYNSAWDGSPLQSDRVTDNREVFLASGAYAMCAAWSGQPSTLLPLLFSDAAANGFAARCLVSHDDVRPKAIARQQSDAEMLTWFNQIITDIRATQDEGIEFAPKPDAPPRWRAKIGMENDAEDLLSQFGQEQEAKADGLMDTGHRHERSFAARAAEQSARMAAVFTAWKAYRGGNSRAPGLQIDLLTMDGAIKLTRWYQSELGRLAAVAGATELAEHASHLADRIAAAVISKDPKLINENGLALSKLANSRGSTAVRNDPEMRKKVIELLQYENYIQANLNSRGRFQVNPNIHRINA